VARKVIETVVSDLNGQTIKEGEAWTLRLTAPDGRRNSYELDVSEAEALELGAKGREIRRRGRPKKQA
jgi:hypothetical protein